MFETEEEAEMQMRFIQALYTGGTRRLPRRVYHCSSCEHWHLTSNRPQPTQSKDQAPETSFW